VNYSVEKYPIRRERTKQGDAAVLLYSYILEMLGSNLDRYTR
jgi:hypothetical protein